MVLTLVITPTLTRHLAVSVRSYLPPFVVLSPLILLDIHQSSILGSQGLWGWPQSVHVVGLSSVNELWHCCLSFNIPSTHKVTRLTNRDCGTLSQLHALSQIWLISKCKEKGWENNKWWEIWPNWHSKMVSQHGSNDKSKDHISICLQLPSVH